MNKNQNSRIISLLIITLNITILQAVDPINDGLLNYYPLRKDLKDVKDNKHGSSLPIRLAPDRFGKDDRAIKFTEAQKVIEFDQFNPTNFAPVSFTFSFWVNYFGAPSSPTNYPTLLSIAHNYNDNHFLIDRYRIYYGKDGSTSRTLTVPSMLDENQWVHIAVVRDKTNDSIEVYKNGTSIGSSTNFPEPNIGCRGFILGNDQESVYGGYTDEEQFYGAVTDFRIYNRAKTSTEVNAIKDYIYCNPDNTEFLDEAENQKCIDCIYPCQLCSSRNTCITCVTTANRKDSTSCDCEDTYYDNDSQCSTCASLNPLCDHCTKLGCTTCQGNMQDRKTDGSCACDDGYYNKADSPQDTCEKCRDRYGTCTGLDAPTSCNGANRKSHTLDCACQDKHYEDPLSNDCLPCEYPCDDCSTQTTCNGCATTAQRADISTCACNNGYYDNDSLCEICSVISPECDTCDKTKCLSCTGDMVNRNADTCQCEPGFFEESASPKDLCSECPDRYLTCDNASTPTSCDGLQRKSHLLDCVCNDNHYEDPNPLSNDCLPCQYPCLACTATQCSSCQSDVNRKDQTSCDCDVGFYDDDTQCQPCPHSGCDTCNPTVCLTCKENISERNADTCVCNRGYYDKTDVSPNVCTKCPDRYAACTDPTSPSECSGNNRKSHLEDCACEDGHYQDPSSVNCLPCSYPCDDCTATQCTSCKTLDFRDNSTDCSCSTGYFDNDTECEKCPSLCSSCSKIKCDGCKGIIDANRNSDTCECNVRFYYDYQSTKCESCPGKFSSCTSATMGECNFLNRNPPDCNCAPGYFSSDGTDCHKCNDLCFSCQGSADNCTICNNAMNRIQDSTCACISGYYNDENLTCQSCSPHCISCSSKYTCDSCANTNYNPPHCINLDFNQIVVFDPLLNTKTVLTCLPKCLACENTQDKCTQCVGKNRQSIVPDCSCIDGFHDANFTLKDCIKCPQGCMKCNNNGICLQCDEDKEKDPFNKGCICKEGTTLNNLNICVKCINFKGQCLEQCPQNSIFDQENNTCEEVQKSNSNSQVILFIGASLSILSMIGFYYAQVFLLKNNKKFDFSPIQPSNQQQQGNQQIDEEINAQSHIKIENQDSPDNNINNSNMQNQHNQTKDMDSQLLDQNTSKNILNPVNNDISNLNSKDLDESNMIESKNSKKQEQGDTKVNNQKQNNNKDLLQDEELLQIIDV